MIKMKHQSIAEVLGFDARDALEVEKAFEAILHGFDEGGDPWVVPDNTVSFLWDTAKALAMDDIHALKLMAIVQHRVINEWRSMMMLQEMRKGPPPVFNFEAKETGEHLE